MSLPKRKGTWIVLTTAAALVSLTLAHAQQAPRGKSSYMPVDITEPFSTIMSRLSGEKPEVEREHMAVLNERYDLEQSPRRRRHDGSHKAGSGRSAGQIRRGNDVGKPRRYDTGADSRAESIPGGLLSVAAPEA